MDTFDWLEAIHQRGWGGVLGTALDALEPLGPLGAQLLWVVQPMARLVGGAGASQAINGLAAALETPGGIAALRARLAGQDSPP